jgi:histidine ammonia-lyase
VRATLVDSRYRQNAERIQASYARHTAPQIARALLEQLAATGRTVLRGDLSDAPISLRATMAIDSD